MASVWTDATMTTDQKFTILISAISATFIIMSAGLGLIIRITARWTRIESNLDTLVKQIVSDRTTNSQDHTDIKSDVRRIDDRINRHEEWHAHDKSS